MEDRAGVLREMRICRFCLTEREPFSNIYDKDKKYAVPLTLQIMACVALEVFSNDGMPQLICDDCRIQTRQSYTFKTMCKRSDDALKLYLATGVLKQETKEIEMGRNLKRPIEIEPIVDKRMKSSPVEETIPVVEQFIETPNETIEPVEETVNQSVEQTEANTSMHETIDNIETKQESVSYDIITDPIEQIGEDIGEEFNEDSKTSGNNRLLELEPLDDIKPVAKVVTHCFPCTSCERSFPLQQLLDIHMRQHTRERKFACFECGKKFFSKHDLSKHTNTHTGTKPFTCIICDKSFSRATLLHRHEKIHVSVPKYLCTYCDKTYLSSEDLDTHMDTHKKKRPFQCDQCSKRFAFKQGLERHEVVHNTENAHKCNYCDESFTTPSKLARHITIHAGARPYPCKLCPRTFLLSHHLSRHLRNHYNQKSKSEENGEHKCDVCSMSFKRRFSLIHHSAIHSMVNLKCVICNDEFTDAQTVKEHITTHLSGLAYPCLRCEYSFDTEEQLVEHEEKHWLGSEADGQEEMYEQEDADNSNETQPTENNEEIIPTRRSQRDKKVKNYADFLKDDDFFESDDNSEEEEEDLTNASQKAIQPVIRSETIKVYKGVKEKPNKIVEPIAPIESTSSEPEVLQKPVETAVKEPKTMTKITTLENLGLSKSTLDAITDKSGFVEMKFGQKVIRVQKLMMTKADVAAMAQQGKIEMKGTKVVMKNTSGGILDLNKLSNIKAGLGNMKEEMIDKTGIEVLKSPVRTYVKKLIKKEEAQIENITETLENQRKENVIIAENIDIDIKTSDDGAISIEENDILGKF